MNCQWDIYLKHW